MDFVVDFGFVGDFLGVFGFGVDDDGGEGVGVGVCFVVDWLGFVVVDDEGGGEVDGVGDDFFLGGEVGGWVEFDGWDWGWDWGWSWGGLDGCEEVEEKEWEFYFGVNRWGGLIMKVGDFEICV